MFNNVTKHFEARKKDERLIFLLDIVSSFSEGRRYTEGRYADLRPSSNVKLLIYRTRILISVGPNDTSSTVDSDVELN